MPSLKTQLACLAFNQGELVVYPTEAVYGIGCRFDAFDALARLRNIKLRKNYKGFIILVSNAQQILDYFPELMINQDQFKQLNQAQKHPTTWIIPSKRSLPYLLAGKNQSLAIRISNHPVIQTICQRVGPIVSSSVNREGFPTVNNLTAARKQFGSEVAFYLNESLGQSNSPSQIIDLNSGEILRSA